MVNTCILEGRLSAEPELKTVGSGDKAFSTCRINIAVQRDRKNAQGQYDTDWATVDLYRQQAELVAKYLHKGDILIVRGAYRTRTAEKDGKKLTYQNFEAEQVWMLPKAKDASAAPAASAPAASANAPAAAAAVDSPMFEELSGDEDLPF